MPGGKRRLKMLLTTGLQVGTQTSNAFFRDVLAGSVSLTSPSFSGNTAGSVETENVSISGLTAAHFLLMQAGSGISPCVALVAANAGAGSAIVRYAYTAGSGGGAAAEASFVADYLAFKLG